MKKYLSLFVIIISLMATTSCSVSFTTVAKPQPTKKMLITSGDMPNKDYEVLGFVESTTSSLGLGLASESQISEMKTEALNKGLIAKGESIGADAIINVDISTSTTKSYFILINTHVFVGGTAIKYKN